MLIQSGSDPTSEMACEIDTAFDPWDNDALLEFCRKNSELKIERTARGEIVIMHPTGWEGGTYDLEIAGQLHDWAKKDGRGIATGSAAGFILPNGAERAPDAAWILRERVAKVPREQRKKFLPLCPDFAVELRSESDSLPKLQAKMEEYIANGAELGWLIDPIKKQVHVYSADGEAAVHDAPASIEGTGNLAGFVLELHPIWSDPVE